MRQMIRALALAMFLPGCSAPNNVLVDGMSAPQDAATPDDAPTPGDGPAPLPVDCPDVAEAEPTTPIAELRPAEDDNDYGWSTAISGDTLVVGAPNLGGPRAGAVYVYTRTTGGWAPQARLEASDAVRGDGFGLSVALDGETLAVGSTSPSARCDAGGVYLFTRSRGRWTPGPKLIECGDDDRGFGLAIALSGDTLLVGAPKFPRQGYPTECYAWGAGYFFVKMTGRWTLQHVESALAPSDCGFGGQLALDGDTAVVNNRLLIRSGRTWRLQQHVMVGSSVAISGDTLAWGDRSYHGSSYGTDYYTGAAYVSTRSAGVWSDPVRLMASDANEGAQFGAAIAISGPVLVVGAFCDGPDICGHGAAYLFERRKGAWRETAKLAPANPTVYGFGWSVACSGNTAAVGAPDADNSDPGAAYAFGPYCAVPHRGGFQRPLAAIRGGAAR